MGGLWTRLSRLLASKTTVSREFLPFPACLDFSLLTGTFLVEGTFCGVFRRQALDRGAAMLGVKTIVTGHNADDIAETVLMNSELPLPFPPAPLLNCSRNDPLNIRARFLYCFVFFSSFQFFEATFLA